MARVAPRKKSLSHCHVVTKTNPAFSKWHEINGIRIGQTRIFKDVWAQNGDKMPQNTPFLSLKRHESAPLPVLFSFFLHI